MKLAIIDIKGIGPAAVATLAEYRINSVNALAGASVEKIAAIPGFSETRAAMVIAEAADLLAASGITKSVDDSDKQHGRERQKRKRKIKRKTKRKKVKGKTRAKIKRKARSSG